MFERAAALSFLLLALSACLPSAPAASYPFVGRWDCEVGTFVFTPTSYDPGDGPLEILDITQNGSAYVLTFAGDYRIGLAVMEDGTMSWSSPASGDMFTCRPLP